MFIDHVMLPSSASPTFGYCHLAATFPRTPLALPSLPWSQNLRHGPAKAGRMRKQEAGQRTTRFRRAFALREWQQNDGECWNHWNGQLHFDFWGSSWGTKQNMLATLARRRKSCGFRRLRFSADGTFTRNRLRPPQK